MNPHSIYHSTTPMCPLSSSSHTHIHPLAFLQSTTQGRSCPLTWHRATCLPAWTAPQPPLLGLDRLTILPTDIDRWEGFSRYGRTHSLFWVGCARWMGRGSRLVRCPQSDIVGEVRMNPLGREITKDVNVELEGLVFHSLFLCKPEPITRSCFNRREACSPFRSSSS